MPGKLNLGVLYKDNVYLFCREECRDKFLLQSDNYASIEVKFPRKMDPIDIKGLPDLGFLEQTVINLIVAGVNETCVFRPKLPGLSSSATAAIFLGVFLKMNNLSCALKDVEIYEHVCRRIFSYDKFLKVAVRTMQKKINPFVKIHVDRDRSSYRFRISGEMSVLSHIFRRPSNLIKFRRTSPTQMMNDPDDEEEH